MFGCDLLLWSSRFAFLLHCLQYSAFFPGLFVAYSLSHFLLVLLLKLTVGCVCTCLCGSFHVFLHVICIRVLESFHVWFCVRAHKYSVRVWQLQVSVYRLLCFLPPYCSGMRSLKLEPFQSSKLLRSELHGICCWLPAVRVVDWRNKPGSPRFHYRQLYQLNCLSSPTGPWNTLCQTGQEVLAVFPPWIPRAKSVVL